MQPNELDQSDPTQPKFGPWGPNPTRNWVELGSFKFIKYIIGLNPNLIPIWDQLDPIGPVFLILKANPTQFNPTFGFKIGFYPKKQDGLGHTTLNMINVEDWWLWVLTLFLPLLWLFIESTHIQLSCDTGQSE